MDNLFIARIDGGLVNKMLAYMSAKTIAKFLNRELLIHWTPHLDGLCENIFILFDDDLTKSITAKEYDIFFENEKLLYSKEDFQKIENIELFENSNIVLREYFLELRPKFIPNEFYENSMKEIWSDLKIKPEILSRVPLISENTITIHVRRHHSNINISMSTYEKIIEKELSLDQNVKFFITTDNSDDKKHLLDKFNTKCFSNEISTYWNVKNEVGVIDAFVDVLTINQTKKIYSPGGSTFTYLSRYGHKKIEFIHIENDEKIG